MVAAPQRLLFVTWDGGGNVEPQLALARLLVDRGHSVRFLAPPSLKARIEASGCSFQSQRVPEFDPSLGRAVEDQIAYWVGLWCGTAVADDLLEEIKREPADALIVDCMLFGALAGAERSGVPTAVLVHFLYRPAVEGPLAERWNLTLPFVNETRLGLGLDPFEEGRSVPEQVWERVAVSLVATPEEFDYPGASVPAKVRYVGPIFDPHISASNEEVPDDHPDPLVLVSFSSTYMHQEAVVQRVLDALADLPVRGLLTLGHALETHDVRPPSNLAVRDWVPHREVLPHVALVITHAGHSTVMAALAHGVPLLCMPMGRDQDFVAERVEALEAGRRVPSESNASEIGAMVEELLRSPGYQSAARKLAAIIERYENGSVAISELERMSRR